LELRGLSLAREVHDNAERSADQLPFASVVVSFHNEAAFLNRCVASLLKQSYPSERYEIILVNDGSEDDWEGSVGELVRANPTRIRVLSQTDKGPAAGRNLGIRNSRGSIVAFTDPDCVVDANWLLGHVKSYTSQEIGGVEGRVETDFEQLLEPIRVSPAGFRYVTCNISYRREALEKVGLFDENFRWKEDDDLAYRVIENSWRLVPDTSAVIYHPVKYLEPRAFIHLALKRRYDVLLYKKHRDTVKRYLRLRTLGPIALSPEFLTVCAGLLAVLLVLMFLTVAPVVAAVALICLFGWAVLKRRSMARRRPKASFFWMTVQVITVEVARLWGSFKFHRFLI
jgi:GT2 family glycosyltransferase